MSWQLESTRGNFNPALPSVRYLDSALVPGTNQDFLQPLFPPDGETPFTVLPAIVDGQRNRISATIDTTQLGSCFIGQAPVSDAIVSRGFVSDRIAARPKQQPRVTCLSFSCAGRLDHAAPPLALRIAPEAASCPAPCGAA